MPNPSPQNRVPGTHSAGGSANPPTSKMSSLMAPPKCVFLPLVSSLLPAATPGLAQALGFVPSPPASPASCPRRGQALHPYIGRRSIQLIIWHSAWRNDSRKVECQHFIKDFWCFSSQSIFCLNSYVVSL